MVHNNQNNNGRTDKHNKRQFTSLNLSSVTKAHNELLQLYKDSNAILAAELDSTI